MVTYVTNWNVHMKFSKKNLAHEISKGSNLFESEPNIEIYLSAFPALKKSRNSRFSRISRKSRISIPYDRKVF